MEEKFREAEADGADTLPDNQLSVLIEKCHIQFVYLTDFGRLICCFS